MRTSKNDSSIKIKDVEEIAIIYATKFNINPKSKLKMKRFIVNLRKKKFNYTKATEDSDTAFEVEEIEKFKMENGKRMFYVKWNSYFQKLYSKVDKFHGLLPGQTIDQYFLSLTYCEHKDDYLQGMDYRCIEIRNMGDYPKLTCDKVEVYAGRIAVLVLSEFMAPFGYHMSHLCHNPPCFYAPHITFEKPEYNLSRCLCTATVEYELCIEMGIYGVFPECIRHSRHDPPCIVAKPMPRNVGKERLKLKEIFDIRTVTTFPMGTSIYNMFPLLERHPKFICQLIPPVPVEIINAVDLRERSLSALCTRYYEGTGSCPSYLHLEAKYKNTWRIHPKDYRRRWESIKAVILEIERVENSLSISRDAAVSVINKFVNPNNVVISEIRILHRYVKNTAKQLRVYLLEDSQWTTENDISRRLIKYLPCYRTQHSKVM